jgi:hypothetical protein
MRKDKQGIDHYSETELIERGWTKSGVSKFLGEPDWNPRFRAYGQELKAKLYREERVIETENTDEWKIWRFKSEKRRQSAQARALVKLKLKEEAEAAEQQEQEEYLEEFLGEVRKIKVHFTNKLDTLDKLRILGEKNWVPAAYQDPNFTETPEQHSDRVTVNYLRHHCTNYDQILEEYDLSDYAYLEISKKVHDLIAKKFPELKKSCNERIAYSAERVRRYQSIIDEYEDGTKPLMTSPEMMEKRNRTMVSIEDQKRLGLFV